MQMKKSTLKTVAEARGRLVSVLLGMLVGMGILYAFKERVLEVLMLPLTRSEFAPEQVVFTGVTELFFVYLKICTWGGVFIGMPYLLYQAWRFMAPGLYRHERRWVAPLLAAVPVLFYGGGVFAYFVVLPLALNFFLSFAQPGVQALPNVRDYLDMLFNFAFAFGLAFNLPVFLLLLVKVGILSVDLLRRWRRFAIIAIFIFAAIVTPPDPFSQLFLALPLILLYEGAIWAAVLLGREEKGLRKKD